jgi:hypothetical protein
MGPSSPSHHRIKIDDYGENIRKTSLRSFARKAIKVPSSGCLIKRFFIRSQSPHAEIMEHFKVFAPVAASPFSAHEHISAVNLCVIKRDAHKVKLERGANDQKENSPGRRQAESYLRVKMILI